MDKYFKPATKVFNYYLIMCVVFLINNEKFLMAVKIIGKQKFREKVQ